ncbi:MAG: acyl-CoA thioesterase, partial [Ilumatobacteraceae bacterium]
MDSRTFLGLEPTADPLRWRMPITQGLCTGRNFLFGGAGLAAGIAALEAVSGRDCVWAAAQFLSFVEVGKTLDIDLVT